MMNKDEKRQIYQYSEWCVHFALYIISVSVWNVCGLC